MNFLSAPEPITRSQKCNCRSKLWSNSHEHQAYHTQDQQSVLQKDPRTIAVEQENLLFPSPTFSFLPLHSTVCVLEWGWEFWWSTSVMIFWGKKCWPVNKAQVGKKTQSSHHNIFARAWACLFRCIYVFFVIHQLDSCLIPNTLFLLFVSIFFTKVAVFKVFDLKAAAWTHIPHLGSWFWYLDSWFWYSQPRAVPRYDSLHCSSSADVSPHFWQVIHHRSCWIPCYYIWIKSGM